jgi:3-deoxy-D-arabino-heptulosonate 7-phosphate (DAHP) synthase class II
VTFYFEMRGPEGELHVRTSGLSITECIGEALALYEENFDCDPTGLDCHQVAA